MKHIKEPSEIEALGSGPKIIQEEKPWSLKKSIIWQPFLFFHT